MKIQSHLLDSFESDSGASRARFKTKLASGMSEQRNRLRDSHVSSKKNIRASRKAKREQRYI